MTSFPLRNCGKSGSQASVLEEDTETRPTWSLDADFLLAEEDLALMPLCGGPKQLSNRIRTATFKESQ